MSTPGLLNYGYKVAITHNDVKLPTSPGEYSLTREGCVNEEAKGGRNIFQEKARRCRAFFSVEQQSGSTASQMAMKAS
jgi:hypothetical protein